MSLFLNLVRKPKAKEKLPSLNSFMNKIEMFFTDGGKHGFGFRLTMYGMCSIHS